MNLIKKLAELQEQFLERTGDLYEYKEPLGALYDVMIKDTETAYKEASKRIMREAAIENAAADYELDCKEDMLTPGRRGLFWLRRNEPADIIYREVWAQAQEMFKQRTEALERLEAALENATQQTRADGEAQEPAGNGETDEPEKTMPGNAAEHMQGGNPDPAPNSSLTAKNKAVKPQTRTEAQKTEKNSKK